MKLNDVEFPLDSEESLGKVLIDNLGKITVNDFTFHINCIIPFHTGFWDKMFIIRFLRNWKIFAFGKEFLSEDDFNSLFFKPLLRFDNFNLDLEYKLEINEKNLRFNENDETDLEMKDLFEENYTFLFSFETLINDQKLIFARNKKYLHYFLENESLIALLSQESFTQICSLINDEGLKSDFINITFVKCLQVRAPSLIPSFIIKTQEYSKYLNLDTLGFFYRYTQHIYRELEANMGSTSIAIDKEAANAFFGEHLSKNFQKNKEIQAILLKAQIINENEDENKLENKNEPNLVFRIYLWKLSSFKNINFSRNLFLSSFSSKYNVENLIISFWKRFQLQPPVLFFENSHFVSKNNPLNFKLSQTINIKKQLNSYYKNSRNVLTKIELSNVDDIFGKLILELISQLPALRKLNVSELNLGDNFCLGLSDYLIERRIRNMITGIHFDLSKNSRVSNVGLKFLYVGLEFSAYEGPLSDVRTYDNEMPKGLYNGLKKETTQFFGSMNKWLGKENYDRPTLMIDETLKSNATFILDHGLGVYLEEFIYSTIGPQKFFCENCEEYVCNKCHKDWSLHTINKKCNDIEQIVEFDVNECKKFNSLMRKAKKFHVISMEIYNLIRFVWLLKLLCHLLKRVINFSRWVSSKAKIVSNKLFKLVFGNKEGRNNSKKGNKIIRSIRNFIFGHETDPEFEIEHFSYHINVTTVDNYLHRIWIPFAITIAFIGFIVLSCTVPFYTNNLPTYIAIGGFLFCGILFEIYLMSRVIRLLNRGLRIKILPSFSLFKYGGVLFEGVADKFDTYSNFTFMNDTFSAGNFDLFEVSWAIMGFYFLISAIKVLFSIYKLKLKHSKAGKANFNINLISRLCTITEFNGFASLLDIYSTKNAVKLFGKFFPQIIITSFFKFIVVNVPFFIIQMIHIFRSPISTVVLISIIFTIYGLISSLVKTLNAKASILTKTMILKKFSEVKYLESLAEDKERVKLVVESEKVEKDNYELPNLSSLRLGTNTERKLLDQN